MFQVPFHRIKISSRKSIFVILVFLVFISAGTIVFSSGNLTNTAGELLNPAKVSPSFTDSNSATDVPTAASRTSKISSKRLAAQPSLLSEPVLFYNANSPNIALHEPVIDSQGNLIVVSSHTSSSCTSSTCGLRLNSISPNGTLNWQTPNNGGYFAPTGSRYWSPVLGPNDSVYVPTYDSVLHAFNSNGSPASGFPVSLAPAGTINWHFPATSPVLVDFNTGLIYASVAQTFSFDSFPNSIIALNPNGSQQWRVDYPNHARNSAAGNLFKGPQQDIYTFLFPPTSARFTRLNKTNGSIVCDLPTNTGSDRAGGDERGIFTDYQTALQLFDSGCASTSIYSRPDRFIEFRKYDQGTIYAIDYPPTGSDPIRLLAISGAGVQLWRNPDIIPHSAAQHTPVRAIKNGIVYVLAFDGSDNNKTKLFAVDSQSGVILSRIDTSSTCSLNCGVAVSDDGSVYLSYGDKIYKSTSPAINEPGGKIVFSGFNSNYEIFSMNGDGTNQTRLTNNSGSDYHPSISPDGKKIVFSSNRTTYYGIYLMNTDGTNQTLITSGSEGDQFPSWSPDGSKIVFTRIVGGGPRIYTMNADGANQRRLPVDNVLNESKPSYSPDGTKILFEAYYNNSTDIFVINSDGTNQIQLTNHAAGDGQPAWSPDGSKIAFYSNRNGTNDIYIMNVDGTNQTRLTTTGAFEPSWSPDGRKIAFVSSRGGATDIYTINADGTNETRLTNGVDNEMPSWGRTAVINGNKPIASFIFAPANPAVNQAVQFTSASFGQGLTYQWDFQSDGIIDSTVSNPQFTFTTAGPRDVTLTVTNAYGSNSATNTVSVGPTNPNAPFVTGVVRTYSGFFLKGFNQDNTFNVNVNWRGSPGRIRFQVNNDAPFEIPGNANGASHAFNMNTAFPSSWSPSVLKITPINAANVVGDTSIQSVYVFPYPTWLDSAILRLGPDVLNFSAGGGEVKANFKLNFPEPAFKANVSIPQAVPYIGGVLGINDTQGNLRGFVSSNGSGNLSLGGKTGFKAMGQEIEGSLAGSGTFTLNPSGLSVTRASLKLGLRGTLSQERGIVEAIPQLQPFSRFPIFKQFNEHAKLRGELKPSLDFSASWKQDSATGDFKFDEGTGRLGLEMRGVLTGRISDRIKAKGWVAGEGGMTLKVPSPFLQSFDAKFEAGVQLNVNYLWGGFDFKKVFSRYCKWTASDSQVHCWEEDNSFNSKGNKSGIFNPKLSLIKNNYNRFGSYETFGTHEKTPINLSRRENEQVPSSITESALISNVFPGAEPTILPVGNNGKLLVYVRQNPNLPILQSTEISWSYYNGTNWSVPAVIENDTRAEMSPVAGVDANGKVVAAWLRIKDPAFSGTISTFEELPNFYKQLEVVSATFDPATGAWSAITALTDDTALDTSLRLSSDSNGKLLLTWQSNPSGEFNADSTNPATLKYSFWNGLAWNAPGIVAGNLTNISEHAAAVQGNNAFIILPGDPNLEIGNDRTLLQYIWNGVNWSAATTFAGGNIDNLLPSAVYDSTGQGQVIWMRGSDLVQATLSNQSPHTVRTGSSSMAFYNARLLTNAQGNLTFVWQEMTDNKPANIFAAIYDGITQTWSRDIRMNDDEWLASDASSYYDNNSVLHIVYLATEINRVTRTTRINNETIEIPNVPNNGQTDLRLLEHSLITDLSTNDADLSLLPQFPQANELVTATLKLKNSGDFSASGFNIKLYAGNPSSGGTLLNTLRVNAPLPAGETQTIEMQFAYPQISRNIVAVIDADNEINEFSEANNTAVVYFENTPPVAIATANITSGNSPLTVNLNALSSYDNEGDALTFSWSFADGSQSMNGANVLHTFSQTGLYSVMLTVTDARGAASTATVYINVGCNTVTIGPATLPNSQRGVFYSQTLSAAGGVAPYSFAVTSGALPAGLTLASSGQLSGTPTTDGNFNFTVTAAYANGCPGTYNYTLTVSPLRSKIFDFDGDGKTDISIFRPSVGEWWYLKSSDGGNYAAQFGASTDKLVPGDFTGDGRADIAIWRPSTGEWFILRSEDGSYYSFPFGTTGDIPATGDFDGDGKADQAVFRPSDTNWYIRRSSDGGFTIQQFGASGDVPAVADYDGDGKSDIAIWRPSVGQWWINRSTLGSIAFTFGNSADKPVQGDYTGDGKADAAIWRPVSGEWFILRSEDFSYYSFPFGTTGDIPAPGDYDGDGRFDATVFRPSGSTWYVQRSTAGTLIQGFGQSGDRPIPNAFVP